MRASLSPEAEADFEDIVLWSVEKFGADAAVRYTDLIFQALHDIEADPSRPGARHPDGLPSGVYTYHLSTSRDHVAGDRVKTPRHFVIYRIAAPLVEVLRILHDSRDLARHLPKSLAGARLPADKGRIVRR